jgi:putative flavoprotein involved in K+ transport
MFPIIRLKVSTETRPGRAGETPSGWFPIIRLKVSADPGRASLVAETTWVTLEPPRFLPDNVDGRLLFERATQRFRLMQEGQPIEPAGGLDDIVMVPSVKESRTRGVLHSVRPFVGFTTDGVIWPDGRETPIDVVIWCTGFRPALDHVAPLGIVEADGHIVVNGTRAIREPQLWLVGYGDWTSFASATILGVGRTARATVAEIDATLREAEL